MDAGENSIFEEIKDDLNAFGVSVPDEDILQNFAGLSSKYNLTASSLVEKYIAFRHNHGLSDSLNSTDMSLFEKENLISVPSAKPTRKSETKPLKSMNALPEEMRNEMLTSNVIDAQSDLMSSYLGKTMPKLSKPASVLSQAATQCPGSSQKASGKVLSFYSSQAEASQSHLSQAVRLPSSSGSQEATFSIKQVGHPEGPSRYMYQRPLARAEVLDSWAWGHIKRTLECLPESATQDAQIMSTQSSQAPRSSLSSVLDASLKQEDTSTASKPTSVATLLRPVHTRLQSQALVAGRVAVCPETSGTEGGTHQQRLHPSNACLVGNRRAGGGEFSRAMLDLTTNASSLTYSLYPGQPVVMKATNLTGRSLTAHEFFQHEVLPVPTVADPSSAPDIQVAIACGPFTTNSSHDISPLLTLLKEIKANRPNVLILLGPLVDSAHPLINDYCESTFEDLYQSRLNTIAEWCHLLKTRVVVVSSWREVCGNPVYPTPPPAQPSWALKSPEMAAWYKNVTFAWDPCTLQIGSYTLGVSSPDVLFQMSSDEINANCTGDRLARLCRHVLTSGSFYPVHPPAEGLPLHYPLWCDHAQLQPSASPHCLILPSRLRAFIKNVEGVICVNPGFVARPGSTANGSYARLILSAKPSNDDDAQLLAAAMDVDGDEKAEAGAKPVEGKVSAQGEVVQL